MVMAPCVLKTVYNRIHFAGVAVCVLGLVLLVVSDLLAGKDTSDPSRKLNKPLGDVLVLIGASSCGVGGARVLCQRVRRS